MASIIKVDQILENTTGVGTNFSTNGSASTPTISIGNQTNKGFYHSATDTIGISIGGNRVGQIDSNGITITQPYWNIVEQQTNGSNPSPSTSVTSTWTARTLNTTIGNNTITGSSLSTNQFTLPSGTYQISVESYFSGGNVKLRLRNITDGSTTLLSINSNTTTAQSSSIHPSLRGRFTITSSKVFELQYWVSNGLTNGLGYPMTSGEPETYTVVELWKLS